MTRRLLLVRHGESTWNAEHRLQGQADPPLSEHGREQVLALRPYLEDFAIERAVSSDLTRALQTATYLDYAGAQSDRRWREIDLGRWSGKRIDELDTGQVGSWRRGVLVPPGGEMWPTFQTRVTAALTAVGPGGGGDVLVVTHGGCIRAACAQLTGADARSLAPPANASITVIELGERVRLHAYGLRPAMPETPGIS